MTLALQLLALLPVVLALPSLQQRDGTTSYVDFSNNTGTPQHLASGILYGVPNNGEQIPSSFYTGMGFNYLRAGGARLPAPARGWVWGMTEFNNRFASALDNYQTAQSYGAPFILLPNDLWGADGNQNSSTPYPGDNGDWTYYDEFLQTTIASMKANNMVSNVIWDLWNEPDLGFYGRPMSQYLAMWGRTFPVLRDAFGEEVLISGPSSSGEPSTGNGWWTSFADFIATNGTIPDQWSWHQEQGAGSGSISESYGGLQAILQQYNLPQRTVNVNEYAVFSEQTAACSAWWISQLERCNVIGLRGNWLLGYQLHDYLASLLSKPGSPDTYSPTGTGYFPNGEWQVYKYYAQSMTGYRVGTSVSSDYLLDTFATVDTAGKTARVLVGVRGQTGTWYVQLDNLSSLGLPSSGSLNIHTYGFPDGGGHYGEVDAPNDLGYYSHPYSGDSVAFPIFQEDTTTAYAFEFALP